MSVKVILAVVFRPWLWATAIGVVFAMAPRRWWAESPYLPLPDREVIAWRTVTAYGSSDADLTAQDVVSYLTWRRSRRRF